MMQYLLLRRLLGPLILVTIGIMALLNQFGVLSFGRSWPLILIVVGVVKLAENLALGQMPPPPPGGFYPPGCGVPPAQWQSGVGQAGTGQPGVEQASKDFTAQSQSERKY